MSDTSTGSGKVVVNRSMSLDGFIAAPGHAMSWIFEFMAPDAFPEIAAATGATFSLLPADNATGNFVKVVQRVPVKIVLDPITDDMVLRPGMSVEATVFIR